MGGSTIFALALLLTLSTPPVSNEAAAWSAIHLTARAAIEGGGLAQERAHSPEIRNLGQLAVRDNSELDRRLMILAAQAGILLADGPKPGKTQLVELYGPQGVAFDRKFLNFNFGASQTLRQKMREAAGLSGNSPLSDLAALFDPIIQQDQFLSGWCLGHCVPRSNP
jgi:hypothetical protein